MSIRNIKLFELGKKGYVPSERLGNFFAEAASICLDQFHEGNKVNIEIQGEYKQNIELEWEPINQQIKDNWGDIEEATEYGATCIAILLVEHLTDYQVIQRSPKQTGFDYWLGKKQERFPFQKAARLEVSGILNGSKSQITQRINQKKIQTSKSDNTLLPAIIVIVEFSNPICNISIR
jgi:hypothetical protein